MNLNEYNRLVMNKLHEVGTMKTKECIYQSDAELKEYNTFKLLDVTFEIYDLDDGLQANLVKLMNGKEIRVDITDLFGGELELIVGGESA